MQPIEQQAKSFTLLSFGPSTGNVLGALGLVFGLCVAVTACSKGSDPKTASGGGASQGGESSAEGGSAQGGVSSGGTSSGGTSSDGTSGGTSSGGTKAFLPGPAACVNSGTWAGKIAKANPNVSVGKTVTCSLPDTCTPTLLVDGKYHNGSGTLITAGMTSTAAITPGWVAVNVGSGPKKLLLTWADTSFNEFNKPPTAPRDYVIETSGDTTTGADGTWTTVATVTANAIRGRSHVFDFDGKSFVRMTVTASQPVLSGTSITGSSAVRLDELALYDLTASTAGTRDGILFMGDSITKMSLVYSSARTTDVDSLITASRPGFGPAMIDSGIGGELTVHGVAHSKAWLNADPALDFFPGLDFVTVAYGTNDSWGNKDPVAQKYKENLTSIIETVIAAGKTPILARIPWNGVASNVLPAWNQIVQDLTKDYDLPCGPDLYTYFAEHQDQLNQTDGLVHPTAVGQENLRRLYAEALLPLYATQ